MDLEPYRRDGGMRVMRGCMQCGGRREGSGVVSPFVLYSRPNLPKL